MTINRDDLSKAFKAAGLQAGDSVILHSSYRSLKPFDGKPTAVVHAVRDVVGESGNIMLPTFNYSFPPVDPYYDVDDTPARTGAIVELGRKLPGMLRSLHPTHSVAAAGPDADHLVCDHLNTTAFGIDSPLDRLASLGGKILLLGVGFTSNSMVHVAEEHAKQPKPPRIAGSNTAKVKISNGKVIDHPLDPSPSCSAGFEAAAYPVRRQNCVTDFRIQSCLCQLMLASDCIKHVVDLLQTDPTALLCSNPDCHSCTGTRKNLEHRD